MNREQLYIFIFYIYAHWSIIKRFAINLICIFLIKYITVHYYFEILKKIININILLSVPIIDSSLNQERWQIH